MSNSRPWGLVLTCSALLAVLVPGALSPVPAAGRAAGCRRLHGKTLVKTAALKVVSQRFHHINRKGRTQLLGRSYLACALPAGRGFLVGKRYREYALPGKAKGAPLDSGRVALQQNAGTFLTAESEEANLTGDFDLKTDFVFNAATGQRYNFFIHNVTDQNLSWAPPVRTLVNDHGQLAGIFTNPASSGPKDFTDPAPGQSEILAFGATGARHVLDTAPTGDLPPASLALSGNTVTWTDKGQPKSAIIP